MEETSGWRGARRRNISRAIVELPVTTVASSYTGRCRHLKDLYAQRERAIWTESRANNLDNLRYKSPPHEGIFGNKKSDHGLPTQAKPSRNKPRTRKLAADKLQPWKAFSRKGQVVFNPCLPAGCGARPNKLFDHAWLSRARISKVVLMVRCSEAKFSIVLCHGRDIGMQVVASGVSLCRNVHNGPSGAPECRVLYLFLLLLGTAVIHHWLGSLLNHGGYRYRYKNHEVSFVA